MDTRRILTIVAVGVIAIIGVVVVRLLFASQADDFQQTIDHQNAIIEQQLRLNSEMLITLDKLQGEIYNVQQLVSDQKARIIRYEKTREIIHDAVAAHPVSELQPGIVSGIDRFRRERDAVQRGGQPDDPGNH